MNDYSSTVNEKLLSLINKLAKSPELDKISPCALEYLLHEFTRPYADTKKYRGYRLLAVDGSFLPNATNPHDSDAFFERGFNLLQLNAMYDLCSRIYVDALIQPGRIKEARTHSVRGFRKNHNV